MPNEQRYRDQSVLEQTSPPARLAREPGWARSSPATGVVSSPNVHVARSKEVA